VTNFHHGLEGGNDCAVCQGREIEGKGGTHHHLDKKDILGVRARKGNSRRVGRKGGGGKVDDLTYRSFPYCYTEEGGGEGNMAMALGAAGGT